MGSETDFSSIGSDSYEFPRPSTDGTFAHWRFPPRFGSSIFRNDERRRSDIAFRSAGIQQGAASLILKEGCLTFVDAFRWRTERCLRSMDGVAPSIMTRASWRNICFKNFLFVSHALALAFWHAE